MTDPEADRVGQKCAAFDVFLDNIPTVANPGGGDKEALDRALRILHGEDFDEVVGEQKREVRLDDAAAARVNAARRPGETFSEAAARLLTEGWTAP